MNNMRKITSKILFSLLCLSICSDVMSAFGNITGSSSFAGSSLGSLSGYGSSQTAVKINELAEDAKIDLNTLNTMLAGIESNISNITIPQIRQTLTSLIKKIKEEFTRSNKRLGEIIKASEGLNMAVEHLSDEVGKAKSAFANHQEQMRMGAKPTVMSTALESLSGKVQGLTKFLPGGELLGSLLGSGTSWITHHQDQTEAVKNADSAAGSTIQEITATDTTLEQVDQLDEEFVVAIKSLASMLDGDMIESIDSADRDNATDQIRSKAIDAANFCRKNVIGRMRSLANGLLQLNKKLQSQAGEISNLQSNIEKAKGNIGEQNQSVNVDTAKGVLGSVLKLL